MNKRRGFTIVELLIVIAIVAILSTASIIGYSSFMKKAKESNDLTFATQLNKLATIESNLDDDLTINDAVYSAITNNVNSFETQVSGTNLVWDVEAKKYVYIDLDGNILNYLEDYNDNGKRLDIDYKGEIVYEDNDFISYVSLFGVD